jgi:hypothetical protein
MLLHHGFPVFWNATNITKKLTMKCKIHATFTNTNQHEILQ